MASSERSGLTVASRSLLVIAGLLAQSGSRFATNLAIGRIGGPASLGVTASASALAQMLTLLWPTSAATAASKFISRARSEDDEGLLGATVSHLKKRAIQSSVLLGVAAFPAWAAIDRGDPGSVTVAVVMTFSFCLYTFGRGVQTGLDQNRRLTNAEVILSVLIFTSVCILLALGVRGIALLAPAACAYLIIGWLCWPTIDSQETPSALRREIDQFIIVATLGTLTSAGMLQVSILLVRHEGGAANAGQYAAALVLTAPVTLLMSGVNMALIPSLASSSPTQRGLRADLATRVLAVTSTLLCGALTLLSTPLVNAAWGDSFPWSAQIMPVFLTAVMSTAIAVPSVSTLAAGSVADMWIGTKAGLCGASVGILAWALSVPSHGYHAVPYGYLAAAGTVASLCLAICSKRYRITWSWLFVRVGCVIAVMWSFVILLRGSGGWMPALLAALVFTLVTVAFLLPEVRLMYCYLIRSRPEERARA